MNQMQDKFVLVKKRVDEIRARYDSRVNNDKLRALVYGQSGTGKTRIALTCPQPVLADSWDPAGFNLRALREPIKEGRIIVDDRFEGDSWKNPKAYREWEKVMAERKRDGVFECIGTYMLDGTSRWAQSLMYAIMAKGGKSGSRAGGTPEIQDYFVQQFTGADEFGRLLDLPCHVLVTGLMLIDKDELTGRMTTGLLLAGKFAAQLPPLFTECYVAQYTAKGREENEMNFRLLTQPDGFYYAKTRMGEGVFDKLEEPNIKKLLKKAGYSDADSPYLPQFLAS